jgi:phage shock protein C
MSQEQRLTRSESDRMVAGVCGGLGEFFGVDANILRVVFVLMTVFGGSGLVVYAVIWLIAPRASRVGAPPGDVLRDNVEEGRRLATQGTDAVKRGYRRIRGDGHGGDDGGGDVPPGPHRGVDDPAQGPDAPPPPTPGAPPRD